MTYFTKNGYKELLVKLLKKKYKFVFFERNMRGNQKIILRHDIDTNLKAALELAKIENSLGIKATYCLMTRSPVYNLFSRVNDTLIREIIALGHFIGLHFDAAYIPEHLNLQSAIDVDLQFLEKQFECKISVVSFHQPSLEIINDEINIIQINTYGKEDMKGIHYISDSNANWGDRDIVNELSLHTKIQLLIHPMWWMDENFESTYETWNNVILDNLYQEQKQIYATERAYGPKRSFIVRNEND